MSPPGRHFYDWPPPTVVYAHDSYSPTDRPPYNMPASVRPYYSTPHYFDERLIVPHAARREYSYEPPETVMTMSSPRRSGTPANTPPANFEVKLQAPPMSFPGAAQKLDATLRKATKYFSSFYSEYRRETKGLGKYADEGLKKRIWVSKIQFAERNPAGAAAALETAKRKNNNNGGYNGGNTDFSSGNSSQQNQNNRDAPADIPTFHELRHSVLECCAAVSASTIPLKFRSSSRALTQQRPVSDSESDIEHYPKDDKMSDKQIRIAESLKAKIQRGERDLFPLVKDMGSDAGRAKEAVNEMRVLQQALKTYKFAWKKGEASESDDEDEDEDEDDKW